MQLQKYYIKYMPVLNCSQKFMKALGKNAGKIFPAAASAYQDKSVLGDWTAHLVFFSRIRFALFVNNKTVLTLFIPYAPKEKLMERFRHALFRELVNLGVPAAKATEEVICYDNFTLEKNTDRSMAGYLNQITFEYKYLIIYHMEDNETVDLEKIQASINDSPRVKRTSCFPNDYVRELFGLEKLSYLQKYGRYNTE